MQWDASEKAGFTAGEPWLPIADDWRQVNVEAERDDPASMLTLYRRLLALRRAEPALSVGSWTPVDAEGDVLAYVREADGARFLVALNLGAEEAELPLDPSTRGGTVVLGTHADREGSRTDRSVQLRADEAVVVRLSA